MSNLFEIVKTLGAVILICIEIAVILALVLIMIAVLIAAIQKIREEQKCVESKDNCHSSICCNQNQNCQSEEQIKQAEK